MPRPPPVTIATLPFRLIRSASCISASFESRLSFLGEGARSLFGVVGGKDRPTDLELLRQRFLLGQSLGLDHRTLDRLNRDGTIGRDLLCDRARFIERFAVIDDAADEADAQRLFRR